LVRGGLSKPVKVYLLSKQAHSTTMRRFHQQKTNSNSPTPHTIRYLSF